MNEIRAKATVLRFLPAWISVAAGLALLVWGVGGAASAQSSEDAGTIQEIKPFPTGAFVDRGDEIYLSVIVIGPDGIEDQSLASTVDIIWSASGGELKIHDNVTSATHVAPQTFGTQTVTASAESECIGEATDCTATFTITVRRLHTIHPHVLNPPRNPPGEIPTSLMDAEGNQYAVFTPEEGGTFNRGKLWASASRGDVPNGEYIGVRMSENGPASNAGMSHHRYTLSGNQYRVSVIDAEGAPIWSYSLNGTVTVCIPVPDELRINIADLDMVTKNNDGTLTPKSTSVRFRPLGLTLCGSTSTLPVTVAVGIPGTPPEPEPTEMLPATGGAVPVSQGIIAWALFVGVALIATGTFASTYRRRRHQRIR